VTKDELYQLTTG